MKKQYWFYIDSYVYVSLKKDRVLLYNPYTSSILEYRGEDEIQKLVGQILSPTNLRVVRLSIEEIEKPGIMEFVSRVREHFMGDIIDVACSDGKPVQMPPAVKIQKDLKYLATESDRSVGENLMRYLSEISLYINNTCGQGCSICKLAYRQFPCCTADTRHSRELDIDRIRCLLEEIKGCPISNINIMGGNIFSHSRWEDIPAILDLLACQKTFLVHYLNAAGHVDILDILDRIPRAGTGFKILITFPVDISKFKDIIQVFDSTGHDFLPVFILQDENEAQMMESFIYRFSILKRKICLCYNEQNIDFFEKNIFISKEDIIEARPTLRQIDTNGSVNYLNFGKLSIFPDGSIHANPNKPGIGRIGSDSIFDVLYKEMNKNSSWFKIRKHVSPCRSCGYNMLCPPISDYNYVIGKYNLCHIYNA